MTDEPRMLWTIRPGRGDMKAVAVFEDSDDLDVVKRYLEQLFPQMHYWVQDIIYIPKRLEPTTKEDR